MLYSYLTVECINRKIVFNEHSVNNDRLHFRREKKKILNFFINMFDSKTFCYGQKKDCFQKCTLVTTIIIIITSKSNKITFNLTDDILSKLQNNFVFIKCNLKTLSDSLSISNRFYIS